MSVDQMRLKAHRFQMKARFKVLYAITIGVSISVFFGWNCIRAQEVLSRMGFGLLSVSGIYFAYQAYKWIWPSNLPQDAPASTSLEFYRSELERRRDYSQHVWRRSGLTFCFLGLALVIAPALIASFYNPRLLVNTVPFFLLLTVWFVAFLYVKKRGQNRLQQEIDELRTFETDGGS